MPLPPQRLQAGTPPLPPSVLLLTLRVLMLAGPEAWDLVIGSEG